MNEIQWITIASEGDATEFGDLVELRAACTGVANETYGVFCGGNNGTADMKSCDYVTIASAGNANDFGDLTTEFYSSGGCASESRGCIGGGRTDATTVPYSLI